MKKIKIICIALSAIFAMSLTSCSLSPCDCANAEINNDTETLKKCEEKVSKMSKEESIKWYKEEAECIETQ